METCLWDEVVMEALFRSCGCLEQYESLPAQGERAFKIGLVGREPLWKLRQGREYGVSITRTALQGGSCLPSSPRLTSYTHGTQALKGFTLGLKMDSETP